MITINNDTSLVKNTTHKVVIPFYVYAAMSFLAATILLVLSTNAFTGHYFQPATLAITHTMALGWGTMIILGAGHQLVPVLIEAKLFSNTLAYLTFIFAGAGIPMLVHGFFVFRFDGWAITGAVFINVGILLFLINTAISISQSKKENVHAVFVFTATIWLLTTTIIGLLLVLNFTRSILNNDSLHYLSLHAHIGMSGWFLLLVMGVASRLIPMFLISKYNAPQKLWWIFGLVNGALIIFIVLFFAATATAFYLLPAAMVAGAIFLFIQYCIKAFKARIRKQVDAPVRLSLFSVAAMSLPLLIIIFILAILLMPQYQNKLALSYGFSIFFGWITAIILGMTFKTLPFIVWNKLFHEKAGVGKTPAPKDLFSDRNFRIMSSVYLAGFVLFIAGIFTAMNSVLTIAAMLLLVTAILYNWNVMRMLTYKPASQ